MFCRFLRTLGVALGKRTLVFSEGDDGYPPMMGYEVVDDWVVFFGSDR